MLIGQAVDSLRQLLRSNATQPDPDAIRPRTLEALTAMGFRLPEELDDAPPGGVLLIFASQRKATLTVYEMPVEDRWIASTLAAITGSTFSCLNQLDATLRSDVVRVLAATRQTSLSVNDLVAWLTEVGAMDLPTAEELTGFQERWSDRYCGQIGDSPSPNVTSMSRFDWVLGFIYDGE